MFYSLYSMSMWEYFYNAGVAAISRECIFFAGVPHLKFLVPLPPVPAGFLRVLRSSRSAGLTFGALVSSLYHVQGPSL